MNTEQEAAILLMYGQMYRQLVAYAWNILGSREQAEEAVQETFQVACRRADALCSSANPQGWLMETLRYIVRNLKRSNQRRSQVEARYIMGLHLQAEAAVEDRVALEVLYEDLAQTEEFQLLVEVSVEGRTIAEAAKERGITVSACKKRVQRAKQFLREALEQEKAR